MEKIQLPRWDQLSEIELYMDQLLSFINSHLSCVRLDDSPVLTRSMVNNYVKNGIVKPPKKKQYKRYHQAYIIVVILLKPCFSMSEITKMIEIYNHLDNHSFQTDYDHFIEIYEKSLSDVLEHGTISYRMFTQPTPEQELMISAIHTSVLHFYTQKMLTN